MKIRYFYTKRQFILKVDIDTKNNKIAIRMTSEGILKLCSDYPIKVLEDLSKQLKKLYGQERKQKGVGKEKNRERIKEYQKQLLERSQLYGVTKDMKKNIEYMLGNKNDNKYFELVEKANEYIDKEEYKKAEEILLEAPKLNKEGYYQIAEMYRYISIEEAIKKYEVAYEKGVAKAASNIGSYYFMNKDTEKAKIWI